MAAGESSAAFLNSPLPAARWALSRSAFAVHATRRRTKNVRMTSPYEAPRERILYAPRVLLRAQPPAIFGRGDARGLREGLREVALIGEAGLRGDRGERGTAGDLSLRPLQAQRAHVRSEERRVGKECR